MWTTCFFDKIKFINHEREAIYDAGNNAVELGDLNFILIISKAAIIFYFASSCMFNN